MEITLMCTSVRIDQYKQLKVTLEDINWKELYCRTEPIEWLRKNYAPADIFNDDQLSEWATKDASIKTELAKEIGELKAKVNMITDTLSVIYKTAPVAEYGEIRNWIVTTQAMCAKALKEGESNTPLPDLKIKGNDLALALRQLSRSVSVHPDYANNSELGDYVAFAEEKLSAWESNTPAPGDESSPWIKVEDRPLIRRDGVFWELTEDGEKEFIAAVPYRDAKADNPDKVRWWIRHCYIDVEGYLYVKRDNEMEENVAGWAVRDITHWMPLPEPPAEWSGEKEGNRE